jgi:hypothetical protein
VPGIVLAWLAGEGLIIYRLWKKDHRPPMPGQLLASSGVFAVLGVLAEAPQARFLASAMAWGFDIAAFMNLAPSLTGGSGAMAKDTAPAKPATPAKPAPVQDV